MDYVAQNIVSNDGSAVLFDVGANIGDYTKALIERFDKIQGASYKIYSFEPAAQTYKMLINNVDSPHAMLNNFGLSDQKTEQKLFYDEKGSGWASLYHRQFDDNNSDVQFNQCETVQLDTLDNYCQEQEIGSIDLLKMDVEGNEAKVLEGGKKMLSAGRIRSIQFEFGGCNIDSRTFFRDFWNILHEQYHIYRIMKDGLLEIGRYIETLEIFSYQNFFAVKKGMFV